MSALPFAVSLLFALFATCGVAAARAQQATSKARMGRASPDSVLVDEDILIAFVDEPSRRFYKAHAYLLEKDRKASADEIRVIAAFLSLAGADAAGKADRECLHAASEELTKLADGVEDESVASPLELNPVFANAYRALAIHHYRKACKAWKRREVARAGRHLRASTQYLEKDAVSAGRKLNIEGIVAFEEARVLSEKLIKGDIWMPEEVGRYLESIGEEIEKLGGEMAKH